MSTLRIEKVDTSLPGTLTPDTLYLVKVGSIVNAYITDSTGSNALPFAVGSAPSSDIHPFLLMGAGNA